MFFKNSIQRRARYFFNYISLAVLFILQSSCALMNSADEHHATRGKLSDAMEKSSDNYQGPREVIAPPANTTIEEEKNSERIVFTSSADETQPFPDDHTFELAESRHRTKGEGVGLTKAIGIMPDNYFQQHSSYQFNYSFGQVDTNNGEFELYARYDAAAVKKGHKIYSSIRGDVTTLGIGAQLKFFQSQILPMLSPYYVGGVGMLATSWDYRNSFTVSDGSTIFRDSVFGGELYLGAGMRYSPIRFVNASIELGPRITLWDDVTNQDFENDVFRANFSIFLSLDFSLVK